MSKTFGRTNDIGCRECDARIESRELSRRIQWGMWDDEGQGFDGAARTEHYCEDCWREQYGRAKAAHYEVTDPERFWDLLEAADGRLVADLKPMTVGGRVWICIVDGDLVGKHSTRHVNHNAEPPVIDFDTERSDLDREWFDEFFENVGSDDGMPMVALLKPKEETPFKGYEPVADGQTRLDGTVETDGGDA